jgi:hypothetical protein
MSIGDIANEAKAILEDIRTNTLGTRNDTTQLITESHDIEGRISHLDGTVQGGFTNLAQGVAILIGLGEQANELAEVNDRQNATMICWLDTIAHVLCDIKHDLDASLEVQRATQQRLDHVDAVLSLVHARESVEVAARDRLQAEIEACCPPEQPRPTPCFEGCAAPELPPFRPVPVDWKPIEFQAPETPK